MTGASKESQDLRPQADEYAVDADRSRHVRTDELKQIRQDRVSNQEVFIGRTTQSDTLTSEAKWQIQRITMQAGNEETKEFAAKGAYNQVWDDRAIIFPPFTSGGASVSLSKPGTPPDYYLDIARGVIPKHSSFNAFGVNMNIGTGSFQDIWELGGLYPFPAAAETLNVVSTDVNDTSAGTGARTVEILGLDTNYDFLTEVVSMNGTTNVITAGSFLRVLRIRVITGGSVGSNIGIITVTNSITLDIIGQIDIGFNQSLMAIFTIPRNHTAYLFNFYFSNPKAKSADILIVKREFGQLFQAKNFISGLETVFNLPFAQAPPMLEARADVSIRAQSTTGNSAIAAGYNLILVED